MLHQHPLIKRIRQARTLFLIFILFESFAFFRIRWCKPEWSATGTQNVEFFQFYFRFFSRVFIYLTYKYAIWWCLLTSFFFSLYFYSLLDCCFLFASINCNRIPIDSRAHILIMFRRSAHIIHQHIFLPFLYVLWQFPTTNSIVVFNACIYAPYTRMMRRMQSSSRKILRYFSYIYISLFVYLCYLLIWRSFFVFFFHLILFYFLYVCFWLFSILFANIRFIFILH